MAGNPSAGCFPQGYKSMLCLLCCTYCSLPRRGVQGIKRMYPFSVSSYTWFIFNLNTKPCYLQKTHTDIHLLDICTHMMILRPSTPYFLVLLQFASFHIFNPSFYLLGDPASLLVVWIPSTLVPGLLSTVPPCCFTHPKAPPQIKLLIYLDDINNISCPVWYKYILWVEGSSPPILETPYNVSDIKGSY